MSCKLQHGFVDLLLAVAVKVSIRKKGEEKKKSCMRLFYYAAMILTLN
jgi:hypothetical protein